MHLRRLWLAVSLVVTAGCPDGVRIVRAGTSSGGGSSAGAPATHVVFRATPTTVSAGVTIDPAVQVVAEDSTGVTDTLYTGTVTLALGNNPGGANLTGTLTIAAQRGVTSFSDLRIDVPGSGYTFTASATGLVGASSASFTVQ